MRGQPKKEMEQRRQRNAYSAEGLGHKRSRSLAAAAAVGESVAGSRATGGGGGVGVVGDVDATCVEEYICGIATVPADTPSKRMRGRLPGALGRAAAADDDDEFKFDVL